MDAVGTEDRCVAIFAELGRHAHYNDAQALADGMSLLASSVVAVASPDVLERCVIQTLVNGQLLPVWNFVTDRPAHTTKVNFAGGRRSLYSLVQRVMRPFLAGAKSPLHFAKAYAASARLSALCTTRASSAAERSCTRQQSARCCAARRATPTALLTGSRPSRRSRRRSVTEALQGGGRSSIPGRGTHDCPQSASVTSTCTCRDEKSEIDTKK